MTKDTLIRTFAFSWLADQVAIHGDVLPRRPLLEKGFEYQGERVPLVSMQGIFKPRIMSLPLSISTAPRGPYDDAFGKDGFLSYRYRGTNPNHRDNVGLRTIMEQRLPLIYFHGIVPNRYLASWPVYIISDAQENLTFKVAVDDQKLIGLESPGLAISENDTSRQSYLTTTVRQRLHQRDFREKVLSAYHESCAFCKLKHRELLDAAHIIPDREPEGKPIVPNGLALCKLHHAAFDSFMIGVRPDYTLIVREDLLKEFDGPLLQHGIKNLHGNKLYLPRSHGQRPAAPFLEWRYERFLEAI